MPETPGDQYFTYDDYLKWPDEERWEIIEGRAYALAPAPMRKHQRISGALQYQFFGFFEGKPCEVYVSPTDVRLPSLD